MIARALADISKEQQDLIFDVGWAVGKGDRKKKGRIADIWSGQQN